MSHEYFPEGHYEECNVNMEELTYQIERRFDRYKIIETDHGVYVKAPFICSNLVNSIEPRRATGIVFFYDSLRFWECRFKKKRIIRRI